MWDKIIDNVDFMAELYRILNWLQEAPDKLFLSIFVYGYTITCKIRGKLYAP